jgi:hypothetical protein
MSRQTFVFDTRLPVGENVSERDPAHPKNVMRNAAIIQNQAMADTKYDIYPPKRVEAFSVQMPLKRVFIIAAILAVIVGITISMRVQNMILRILLILAVVYSLHYLVAQLTLYSN